LIIQEQRVLIISQIEKRKGIGNPSYDRLTNVLKQAPMHKKRRHNTQRNDILQNDAQHIGIQHYNKQNATLSILTVFFTLRVTNKPSKQNAIIRTVTNNPFKLCHNVECCLAECYYAECRGALKCICITFFLSTDKKRIVRSSQEVLPILTQLSVN
jgi:hypothetical protein